MLNKKIKKNKSVTHFQIYIRLHAYNQQAQKYSKKLFKQGFKK